MTSSPLSTNSSSGALPNFRTSSPFPQILRSAAASSSSSLSSLFQYASSDFDYPALLEEAHVHHATIAQAFCPTVAVVSSKECDEKLRAKGFTGLLDMLRPFGDCVQGKVNIRDSQAMSTPVEDFSVRFVDFHHYARGITNGTNSRDQGPYAPKSPTMQTYVPGGDLVAIERLLETKIESTEKKHEQSTTKGEIRGSEYSFFLRKMLSAIPVSAHETFSHPVACILAVSSHHPEPIDALLGLYNTTNNAPIPRYIDAGFLRYYVLIHDDDKDDFEKSNATLEKMKRSLGLHCTILRISTQATDKDTKLEMSRWLSAGEELAKMDDPREAPKISPTDIQSLQKFTRDMVTQSVVPHMERCITMWNDQIASYRRGLAGRVFTASRRLFGGSSRSATPTAGSGNYDFSTSSYPPSTPEAQMRKLADYAFMLRDWRLAHSTFDILRKDFANDKAWKYAAGAQEMTALTLLLLPSSLTASKRAEILDPLLDSAIYSYTARSSSPYFSLRTTLISVELLTLNGGTAPDDAVKWAVKALGSGAVGDIESCLIIERISNCYRVMHPSRRRKMALWSMLACESWMGVGSRISAVRCLREAVGVYQECQGFGRLGSHLAGLMESLGMKKEGVEKVTEVVDMQHEGESGVITVEFA